MAEHRISNANIVLRGCIKTSKGPWVVRRATRNGGTITKYRYPSDRERLNNKQREKNRRAVTHNIFAGLRAHGNYRLPKNADTNDLLKALCEEAGWYVEEDGTVRRKTPPLELEVPSPTTINMDSSRVCMPMAMAMPMPMSIPAPVPVPRGFEGRLGYCTCQDNIDALFEGHFHPRNLQPSAGPYSDLTLSLSLPLPFAHTTHHLN